LKKKNKRRPAQTVRSAGRRLNFHSFLLPAELLQKFWTNRDQSAQTTCGAASGSRKSEERRIIVMAKSPKGKILSAVTTAELAFVLFTGFSTVKESVPAPSVVTTSENTPVVTESPVPSCLPNMSESIVYQNAEYGFTFALPTDWKGYSIVKSNWQGLAVTGDSGEKVVETGPIISIRNPQWTSKAPTQDIPIMIFTLDQWNALQNEDFHIGASPIGPSELGRNNQYVFALPARYNFAFPKGYEEVESILAGKPLTATQVP
jgi:hypothetical protein